MGQLTGLTGLGRAKPLSRRFFGQDALTVAEGLMGAWLVVRDKRARHPAWLAAEIVEVEAYLGEGDPASHSHRGPTPRCRPMFDSGGLCYVYLSYGINHCVNVVTGPKGRGEAVLLRAARPLVGLEEMRRNRRPTAARDIDLLRGPGRLARGLGIDLQDNGCDFFGPDLRIIRALEPSPYRRILRSPRIGISKATDLPFRLRFADCPWVSGPR